MKQERHAEVMEAALDMQITLALPAEGIGVILAALRLFVMHPEYTDLCLRMRSVVVHLRNVCRQLMMEIGFSRGEVDLLDSEQKPVYMGLGSMSKKYYSSVCISRDRMVEVYQEQAGQYFRLQVDPIGVTVIHGAIMMMNAHPQGGGKSQVYRDLVRAIRDLLMACYTRMGFTSEEAHYLDTKFVSGGKSVGIRSAKPIYYTDGKEVSDADHADRTRGEDALRRQDEKRRRERP